MASSILMSNSNSNCAMATPAANLLSTITNSKPNPTSNSNCTLVTENHLKVTTLQTSETLAAPPCKAAATAVHVVVPPSKPSVPLQQNVIVVKEIALPSSPSSSRSSTSDFSSIGAGAQHQVRVVGWKECKAVARTLAESFKDDPVCLYYLSPDDAAHRSKSEIYKLHLKICEYVVAAHCMHGLVLSIGANHEGVALWMPPGKDYDDYWSIIRSGMWRLYYQLTKEGRRRYFEEIFGLAAHTKYLQIWTDCH